jgi:hypothetical protein
LLGLLDLRIEVLQFSHRRSSRVTGSCAAEYVGVLSIER